MSDGLQLIPPAEQPLVLLALTTALQKLAFGGEGTSPEQDAEWARRKLDETIKKYSVVAL